MFCPPFAYLYHRKETEQQNPFAEVGSDTPPVLAGPESGKSNRSLLQNFVYSNAYARDPGNASLWHLWIGLQFDYFNNIQPGVRKFFLTRPPRKCFLTLKLHSMWIALMLVYN